MAPDCSGREKPRTHAFTKAFVPAAPLSTIGVTTSPSVPGAGRVSRPSVSSTARDQRSSTERQRPPYQADLLLPRTPDENGMAMDDTPIPGPLDWGALATELGTATAGGQQVAQLALTSLIGDERLRAAVDWYMDRESGSESICSGSWCCGSR